MSISSVINIVLSVLLIVQWYKQQAREESVKNHLFSLRRILERQTASSSDFMDVVDGILATLGARVPFNAKLNSIITTVKNRFSKDAGKELSGLTKLKARTKPGPSHTNRMVREDWRA